MTTDASVQEQTGRKVAAANPCDRNRILIVDDEKAILDVFRRLLSMRLPNCRIDVAVNGAEGVAQFQEAHHGVILMDLRMPVMDGQTAFGEIQKFCQEENIEMPAVVFCTGYDPPGSIQELVAGNPAHCILRKPVNSKLLFETLQARLGPSAATGN